MYKLGCANPDWVHLKTMTIALLQDSNLVLSASMKHGSITVLLPSDILHSIQGTFKMVFTFMFNSL